MPNKLHQCVEEFCLKSLPLGHGCIEHRLTHQDQAVMVQNSAGRFDKKL